MLVLMVVGFALTTARFDWTTVDLGAAWPSPSPR